MSPVVRRLPAQESDWSGQRALVLGAGQSGLACARWLDRQGAAVTLVDSRTLARPEMPDSVVFQSGLGLPFPETLLAEQDLVVASPGLSPHPDRASSVAHLIAQAHRAGLLVLGELDLFEWALARLGCATPSGARAADAPELALGRPAVLAITGTNGKTTTAVLTARLLESTGLDVQLAGNVSPSMLAALLERQQSGRPPQVWVVELSSFQLAWASRFHPTASVILNLTDDHLDWHLDRTDYRLSKLRVLGLPEPMGRVVVPMEEPELAQQVLHRAQEAGGARPAVWSFGLAAPKQGLPGLGIQHEGIDWIVLRRAADAPLERLMPAAALRIAGTHNQLNAMAALALALSVSDDLASMLHALRHYTGEPHRLSLVASLEGVEFVDDSKGTNVGATVAALRDGDYPLAVILGGEGKGQDFGPLAAALRARGACAVGIGRDGPLILQAAERAGVETLEAGEIVRAIELAHAWVRRQMHQSGRSQGRVLLSPACASFDQFRHYAHRGEVFGACVQALAHDQGGQP